MLLLLVAGADSIEGIELNFAIAILSPLYLSFFRFSLYMGKTGRRINISGLLWRDQESDALISGGSLMFFCDLFFTLYSFLMDGFKMLVLVALIFKLFTSILALVSGYYSSHYKRYKFFNKYQIEFRYTSWGKKKRVKY